MYVRLYVCPRQLIWGSWASMYMCLSQTYKIFLFRRMSKSLSTAPKAWRSIYLLLNCEGGNSRSRDRLQTGTYACMFELQISLHVCMFWIWDVWACMYVSGSWAFMYVSLILGSPKPSKIVLWPEVAILIVLAAALTRDSYINTTCSCFDALKVYNKTRLSYINHQNIHTNGRLIRVWTYN